MNQLKYATFTEKELEQTLKTNISNGLATKDVANRLKQYGPNNISVMTTYWWTLLIKQFSSPFLYLLFFAAIVSFATANSTNGLLILVIIMVNTLLSFLQEYRAEKAARLLKQHLIINTHVKRNGHIQRIDSNEIVPGDIIVLQAGDHIPADLRFVEAHNLTLDESLLTGESVPVSKTSNPLPKNISVVYQALNMGFLGTYIVAGSAIAIAIATGASTQFGTISQLALLASGKSSFQLKIKQLSTQLFITILATLAGLFIINLIIKGPHADVSQLLLFSIALAIGITPEALPMVVTFALTQGALKLAEHHVIVKRLSAIEDLGSITLLCTDKTGTLTENRLSVVDTYIFHKSDPLLLSIVASGEKIETNRDPFIRALWQTANPEQQKKYLHYKIEDEIQFNAQRRHNTVLVSNNNHFTPISRGAFEEIITYCTQVQHDPNKLKEISAWQSNQGINGHRTIAIAYKKINHRPSNLAAEEHDMEFAGIIAFEDPIKHTAKSAIKKAHFLGITIKMITGDSKEVACTVAKNIGLTDTIDCSITGFEFQALSLEAQQKAVENYAVFARISPEQKYQIVNYLKHKYTVAYLGDGINDAPALKAAHVAIVVRESSDIAQDIADIILLKKSLAALVEGISIGRAVFANTFKYIRITLSANFGNFYSMAFAALFINFLPMLPLQILLLNLLSDLPMIGLAIDTVDKEELRQLARFDQKQLIIFSTIFGLISSVFDIIFFSIFAPLGAGVLQTNWFIESILSELVVVFSLRTRLPFYQASRPSLSLIVLSIVCAAIALVLPFTFYGSYLLGFKPPALNNISFIVTLLIIYFFANELAKLVYYRRK